MEPKIQEKVWDPKIESGIRKKWEDSKLYEFHPDTDGYTIDTPPPVSYTHLTLPTKRIV